MEDIDDYLRIDYQRLLHDLGNNYLQDHDGLTGLTLKFRIEADVLKPRLFELLGEIYKTDKLSLKTARPDKSYMYILKIREPTILIRNYGEDYRENPDDFFESRKDLWDEIEDLEEELEELPTREDLEDFINTLFKMLEDDRTRPEDLEDKVKEFSAKYLADPDLQIEDSED